MDRKEYSIRLLLGSCFVLFIALCIPVLPQISQILLIILTGMFLGIFLHKSAELLQKKLPLSVVGSLFLLLFSFILFVTLVFWWIGPQLAAEFNQLTSRLPQDITRLIEYLQSTSWGNAFLQFFSPQGSFEEKQQAIGQITSAFTTLTSFFAALIIILFITLYVAINPNQYKKGIAGLFDKKTRQKDVEKFLEKLSEGIWEWFKARLLSMLSIGVLTALLLDVFGIPLAYALGLIAAVFAFIPLIGPLLSSVPAAIIAFGEGMQFVVIVFAIYSFVQFLEGNVITPLIAEKVVSLAPVIVISAQLIMAALFGFMGIFLATPLAVLATISFHEYKK